MARVNTLMVQGLGLDPEVVDFSAPETLAAALRRAASFLCPATPSRLIDAVEKTLSGLSNEPALLHEKLEALLDAMIGYGDLLELTGRGEPGDPRTMLYLAFPGFVKRRSGSFFLFGIRSDAVPLVGEELSSVVEYERHVRRVPVTEPLDVEALLTAYGLRRMPEDSWLGSPRPLGPDELIRRFDTVLDAAPPSGDIAHLLVTDPNRDVQYYKGRWRGPSPTDSGRFVARRPQAYGAPIWCYAEIVRGVPIKVVDLPLPDASSHRGCDDAWRLQAALDAVARHPQVVRVRETQGARVVIDLFAPPPWWLQRRWDTLGTPTVSLGALVSYRMGQGEVAEEVQYAARMLWLRVSDERA